jgi:glycosyltransferase involved in cell wall biosynthesis
VSPQRRRPGVILLDPGNYTPYYDLNLAHALAQRGWPVEVATSPYLFEALEPVSGVEVRHYFFRLLEHSWPTRLARRRSLSRGRQAYKALAYPVGLLRLARELERRPPGILHVEWGLLPLLDARLWRRLWARGWKVVYTAHEVTPVAAPNPPLLNQLYRRLPEVSDLVIVHSSSEASALEAHGVPAGQLRRIPQGDLGLFGRPSLSVESARATLGLDPKRPILLFFGLLKAYKGLDVLLRSLPAVRRAHPDVLLLVAGERMDPFPRASLDLDGSVEWHDGYVATEAAARYLAAADVVVLPYKRSSSSGVVPAAYAHGRPVVATTVGGLPEMIEPGRTGLLVPPDDEAALAGALISLLDDPAATRAMGERARRLAAERHAWPDIAARTEAVYEEALE